MATIAVWSVKGGVGKSTLAAALAWNAATVSRRRTLLWDLDEQGAAAFLLGLDAPAGERAAAVLARDIDPHALVTQTAWPNLDLLPADASLREAGALLRRIGKRRRLRRLTEALGKDYERIVLDCPPLLGEMAAQVLRAADVVIVPLPPSPLARRALGTIRAEMRRLEVREAALLPVFSMVDRRRRLHRAALGEEPDWPVIPMASRIEAMAEQRMPIGAFAPAEPPARAIAALWTGIERRLCRS